MGCASSKPESHTKKPALNQNSGAKNLSNLNTSRENPEVRNESKPAQRQNPPPILPVLSNQNNSQTQPVKSTLQDLQKNSSLTKQEAQKTILAQQKEVKKQFSELTKQVKEEPFLPIVTPVKEINAPSDKKPMALYAIPERTEESEFTKKPNVESSGLKAEEKHEEIKNSARNSLLNSIPNLDENFQVSKISKNQSAEKIQNQQIQKVKEVQTQNQKSLQNHGITTQEIQINVLETRQSKLRESSPRPDQFAALVEEQFDLNCSFDPNTLVIDMNKVTW